MKKEYTHFTSKEREDIYNMRQDGLSIRSIARSINRSASSVSRELLRNRYNDTIDYLPDKANKMAADRKHILAPKLEN